MTGRIPTIAFAALAVAAVSCGPPSAPRSDGRLVQPGAPGEQSRAVTPEQAEAGRPRHTEADVRFMQDMITHHAQAVEMTTLLKTRSTSEDMQKLAQRIELSQDDEMRMMKSWLTARGAALPDPHAHHAHGGLMRGMASPEEMQRLASLKGTEFDRLFLELMIKHHEGALTMVEELFATPGAGQEAEVFAFASDVNADQRMEIRRMGQMLARSAGISKE
jgi:uncharacterized protein (DUF305 family)